MSSRSHIVALAAVVALAAGTVGMTAQQRPNGTGTSQTRDLLRRLDAGIVTFRASFDRAINRSRINGTRTETDINKAVNDFKLASDRLGERGQNRRASATAVEDVLKRAAPIDEFMAGHTLDATVARDWRSVRDDLDALAGQYNVASAWSSPRDEGDRRQGVRQRLTGTYQLESSRGDNADAVVERATRALPSNQRQAASRRLMNRLDAPETIAIDRNGNNITMASSRGRQVTFEADGQVRREQSANGRTMETRAALTGDQLMVTTTGNRGSDYAVTFEPLDNGRNMRVTRRIQDDTLRQPVTVNSFYRKSSDEPLWDIDVTDRRAVPRTNRTADDFEMPDGTRLVATLDNPLSTRDTSAEDRFTLTTRSPSPYEGAVIEGTISSVNASGRVSGRADMALNFDRIRLRNGRTYEFAGVIESVRKTDGDTIRVDNEGKVGDGSQTEKTVQVGAIGAALGAIIGAITGGGSGAAIGAAIGAAGGAGTVVAQGRDHLDLPRGTELTIVSGVVDAERSPTGRQR
jgi:hypothetical protein